MTWGYLHQPDWESKGTVEMSIYFADNPLKRLLQIYSMILILFSLQYK